MIAKIVLCASLLLVAPSAGGPQKSNEAKQPREVEKISHAEEPKELNRGRPEVAVTDTAASGVRAGPDLRLLPIEANIISFTNAERAKYGLRPLQVDPDLMKSARRHAAWMTRHGNLVHTSRPVGENIAMGQPHSRVAVRDWMNSPGHRANILDRGYRRIGAAAYRTRGGTIYWCQQFGR